MPKKSKGPIEGHSYRFDLGNGTSAADVMFSVWVLGPIDEAKAVAKAKSEMADLGDGVNFHTLPYGRVYFHPDLVTRHMIVDISPLTE